MKIALAQVEIIPADPSKNFKKVMEYVSTAKANHADIVVFPELMIPGYLLGDMWEEESFLKDCMDYNNDVIALSDDITIIFGSIDVDWGIKHTDGRSIIRNVLICATNRTVRYYIKTLLPNYREFEEPRHFRPALGYEVKVSDIKTRKYFTPQNIKDTKVGLTICEDGWDDDYPINPMECYRENEADLMINISCSPYTIGKNNSRNRVFGERHAKYLGMPIIYVNAVGIQNNGKTIYTFDGSSVVYDETGKIIAQAPMFKEHMMYVEWCTYSKQMFPGEVCNLPESDIAEVAEALKYGIGKYLEACGTKRVVIGASGGIDSCVAASLYAQVVGPENLLLVNMPSKYNSKTTISIARKLAKNIECYYTSIPIEDSVNLTKKQIDGLELKRFKKITMMHTDYVIPYHSDCDSLWEKKTLNLTPTHMENVQARDRSSRILSALSSAWGGVFTNNGNKDEGTVGYATLYGDVAGFLAALGDLRKPMVYELGEYLNKTYPVIPEEAFTVVASAELSNNQSVDDGKGDPLVYWYHSRLFYTWVESWYRKTPEDNLNWYLNGTINNKLKVPEGMDVYKLFPTAKAFTDDIEHWYKLFKGMAVAKRIQAPPVLAVTRRAFGFDLRESLNCWYLTRGYYNLKEQALNGKL